MVWRDIVVLFALRAAFEARFDGGGVLRCVFGVVLCGVAIGLSGFVCVVRLVFCRKAARSGAVLGVWWRKEVRCGC